MPARVLAGAMCVQRLDDSLNSAIHITYRISLRSSSMPEPRDPLLKVVTLYIVDSEDCCKRLVSWLRRAPCGLGPPLGRPAGAYRSGMFTVVWESGDSVMIPPLVHQRRPCYDFYFL